MASKTLDFIQILYSNEQIEQLYSFSKPHFSVSLTPYFENSIIENIVPKSEADFISVCSWRLRQKRGDGSSGIILQRAGLLTLTEDGILDNDFDVAILTPRNPSHKMLVCAEMWHGKSWVDAFTLFTKEFLRPLGIRIPKDDLKHVIYENHFIATREIYHEYVRECLSPAIKFMESRSEFMAASGYKEKKFDKEEVKRTLEKLKMDDYPIAPFILERLFSIWINNKNYKVINL